MVPADARYLKGFTEDGKPDYKWPKFLGFVRATIRSVTREDGLPDTIDRYGYNGGTNFAAVPKEGRYSFLKRAIPYLQNEKSYHKFEVKYKEHYCDKIDAICSGNFNKLNEILAKEQQKPILKDEFIDICNNYARKIREMKAEEGITADVTYGLKGTVAQYSSKTPELPGGAEQYTLPLNADDLIKIKVLEE